MSNYGLQAIFKSLVPDKARPLQPRPYLLQTIYLTCAFGALLPPGKLRAGSVSVIVCALITQIPKYTTGDVNQDAVTPIFATLLLAHWIDVFILHSPEEFSRRKDGGKRPRTWREKLWWSLDLNSTMRGIGWNWEVKNVPDAAPIATPKWQFVRTETAKTFLFYVMLDICGYIGRTSLYRASPTPDLFSDTFPRQLLYAWIPGLVAYYAINVQYSLSSAVTVATGLLTPQDWPPIMGRLRDVCTVRGLWGKFWHQLFRRKLNLPFNILNRCIPITRGTLLSKYLQLYLAFIASGCLHTLGAMNLPHSTHDNNMLQLTYFLLQPVAITVEDFAIHLGKKWGVKPSWKTKLLGRVWTFSWFTWSLRYMALHQYNMGAFELQTLPSIVVGALGLLKSFSGSIGLPEL